MHKSIFKTLGDGKKSGWTIDTKAFSLLNLNNFEESWAYYLGSDNKISERCFNSDNGIDVDDGSHIRKDSYAKYNYRLIDGYHILDLIPVDIIKKENKHRKVEYRYNSDWFRSDHFTKDHDGLHILFSGCSNTEGVGANIENIWSNMLYQRISAEHKTSGFFSLARAGGGWHKIMQNFNVYVKKYGAPDYFFILHPNILRGFKFIEDDNFYGWQYYQANPWQEPQKIQENIQKHRDQFPQWLISWKIFLEYCESIGTKVLWATWDQWEVDNISNSDAFNNFIPLKEPTYEDLATKYADIIDREDAIEARDGHAGYIHQYHWYSEFKSKLIENGVITNE